MTKDFVRIMRYSALLAALSASATACAKKAESDEKVQAVVQATIVDVGVQHFTEIVDAVGTVAPRAGHIASLAAPSPTRVAKVYVSFGAHVKAGEPLVDFEQAAFDAAAKGADASLMAAERNAERTQRLADAGVIPRKDAEAAAADLGTAKLNDVNARRSRDLATLRSPIDGVVTRMAAVLGASADPSQVMVEIADPRALDVQLTLSPTDASRVADGQHVALYAGASASGSPVATGRVADVSAAVDTASRGVGVRVQIPEGGFSPRIGQTMFGRIAVAEHDRAVVIPLAALVPTGEAFKVFVVDDKGIAESRPVKIGGRTDTGAWITDGLKAGEKIVTTGAYGVDDSTKVVNGGDKDTTDSKPEAGSKKPEARTPKSDTTDAKKPAAPAKKP
jgi:RND family efflux transporter MFP subunit